MPPDNTLLKYIAVRKLAEQGAPGERDNAKRRLASMEQEYPNIKAAVREFEQGQKQKSPRGASESVGGGSAPLGVDWRQAVEWAKTAASYASGMAETLAAAEVGRTLAGDVDVSVRGTETGAAIITFKLRKSLLSRAHNLNEMQQQTFRSALHAELDEMLAAIFEPEEDTDDEADEDEDDE